MFYLNKFFDEQSANPGSQDVEEHPPVYVRDETVCEQHQKHDIRYLNQKGKHQLSRILNFITGCFSKYKLSSHKTKVKENTN